MINFFVYEKSLLDEADKKQLINDFISDGYNYTKSAKEAEYIFVFGGDGTFIKALKDFYDTDKKLVLFNVGNLGFLSSIDETIGLNEQEAYTKFDYLSIKTKKQEFVCINEVSILTDALSVIDTKINKLNFKSLMTNQINVINNLGSTGINRSHLKPLIFPWNHQYIVDVMNEPIYSYYNPLLQPFILTGNDAITFSIQNQNSFSLKIDNQLIEFDNENEIYVEQKTSKCKILNTCLPKTFFFKLNKLL